MRNTHATHCCRTGNLCVQSCGLPVHGNRGLLCTASELYAKYIHGTVEGVYSNPTYTRLIRAFSHPSSTIKLFILPKLGLWLYTLSTGPITTRIFLKNYIFISNSRGART